MALSVRKVIFGAVVLAAAGAAAYELSKPEHVPVDIATLGRGVLEVTVDADGQTRIRNVFEVSAPVSGQVLRSPVTIGSPVVADETVVARIQPGEPAFLDERARRQAEAAVAQAKAAVALADANVRAAEADLNNAQRQLNRVFSLNERGSASEAQLEQAEVALDIAAAQLDSAHATQEMRRSELAAAQAVLIEPGHDTPEATEATNCCIELTAPITGEVLSVVNESARMVSAGTPLLTMGRRDDLEISVDLLSSDAVRIAAGAPAYVERWGGDHALAAEVREIEPAAFTKISALGIEEQRVRVLLDFVTPADERPALGHNFRVYLRIVEWRGEDVLRLPISALFREDGDWAVFAVEDGTAHVRKVEVGRRNTEFAEVRGGLEPGDLVITHPSDKVAEGVLVVDRSALE
ncbi:efflux RND transporter periplasmic adaptor subunit [Maritimibacter fusiformis]|uniref:HlyD family efflux transporter periplasmic adaptor subunit n=1 Tax=Maritimibacter fusiformis TaxID=2603819 RepID=A0A5D0RNJ6_9RHOB|nr:HlyD family efflux transporter periplasmic adaptor subunit [Maritimibacter fusiformis]TYB82435.1 HlyD family efflux transporter periplasmic adaptor subunit [Maritimibacter fusiformis]